MHPVSAGEAVQDIKSRLHIYHFRKERHLSIIDPRLDHRDCAKLPPILKNEVKE